MQLKFLVMQLAHREREVKKQCFRICEAVPCYSSALRYGFNLRGRFVEGEHASRDAHVHGNLCGHSAKDEHLLT